jgi:hypothetical protein
MAIRRYLQQAIRALGPDEPPEQILVCGRVHRRVAIFKHDFFAATALYDGPCGKVVLKLGRTTRFLGVPLAWIGRLAARHESRLYELLDGVTGIPRFIGRWRDNGLMHEYIEGHQLAKGEWVNDQFFDRLTQLLDEVHRRDAAYVDMEKRENILVGDDGRPYLIDFQISWHLPPNRGGRTSVAKFVLRVLQASDRYHLLKHRRRQRPDLLTPAEFEASYQPPIYISWHRYLFRPFTKARRKALRRIEGNDRD